MKFAKSYTRPAHSWSKPVYSSNSNYKPQPVRPKFHTSHFSYQPGKRIQQGKYNQQGKYSQPGKYNQLGKNTQPYKPAPQNPLMRSTHPIQSQLVKSQPIKSQPIKASKPIKAENSLKAAQPHVGFHQHQSTSGVTSSTTATQQSNPGPWSGKHGSKRGQQQVGSTSVEVDPVSRRWRAADDWNQPKVHKPTELNGQSTKPVHENIYITIDNDSWRPADTSTQTARVKTKNVKVSNKPEWSSNFEVPPRFRKLTLQGETTAEGKFYFKITGTFSGLFNLQLIKEFFCSYYKHTALNVIW